MSETTKSILEAALKLSDEDREGLTIKLLDSLPPSKDWEEVSDDEIVVEVMRRHEAAQNNQSSSTPAEDVHARLMRELHAETPR